MRSLDLYKVKEYFAKLQNDLCLALESEDGIATFKADNWNGMHGEGSTRIITDGDFIEHGAVNFSFVSGNKLPSTASARYPELAGASFQATGVSLIIHPSNPYVPTTHANVRFLVAHPNNGPSIWWFGGGYDLTPVYPFDDDCRHWHQTAYQACAPYGLEVYSRLKQWCDKYFYLPHRDETRGIGGLFFDDLNRWSFSKCFDFVQSIGNSFAPAYLPIVRKRKGIYFGEKERDFQLYRRGRYVEFNLLHDRGTLFGLQSKGRSESILSSMPPLVKWRYNWQPDPYSAEARLSEYLKPREWVTTPLEQ